MKNEDYLFLLLAPAVAPYPEIRGEIYSLLSDLFGRADNTSRLRTPNMFIQKLGKETTVDRQTWINTFHRLLEERKEEIDPEAYELFIELAQSHMDQKRREEAFFRLQKLFRREELLYPEVVEILNRILQYVHLNFQSLEDFALHGARIYLNAFQSILERNLNFRIGIVERRLSEFEESTTSKIESQSRAFKSLMTDLESYFWLASYGADFSKLQLKRYIPVRIYISDSVPNQEKLSQIVSNIERFASAFDFIKAEEFPPEEGSWFKRILFKTRQVFTLQDVVERMEKAEGSYRDSLLRQTQGRSKQTPGRSCISFDYFIERYRPCLYPSRITSLGKVSQQLWQVLCCNTYSDSG